MEPNTSPYVLEAVNRGTGCQNCHYPVDIPIEISKMIQHEKELLETPVVAVMSLCADCLSLMAAGNWIELARRGAR